MLEEWSNNAKACFDNAKGIEMLNTTMLSFMKQLLGCFEEGLDPKTFKLATTKLAKKVVVESSGQRHSKQGRTRCFLSPQVCRFTYIIG